MVTWKEFAAAEPDPADFVYVPKEKVVATGDAVIDWMPFFNDGYPEEWIQTVANLETLDIVQIVVGHGDPVPKSHLAYFRGYLTDLVGAVKKATADGMPLPDMKKKVAEDLAGKYETTMSKYPLGRYRDRIDANVEQVYTKTAKKS